MAVTAYCFQVNKVTHVKAVLRNFIYEGRATKPSYLLPPAIAAPLHFAGGFAQLLFHLLRECGVENKEAAPKGSTRPQLPKVRHEHDGEVFMGPEHQYCK